jgi:TonB family protein
MKKYWIAFICVMAAVASSAAWGLPTNTVWVRVSIDPTGAVSNLELVQNTGTPDMAAATFRKLRTMRYKPAIVNGHAVARTMTLEISIKRAAPAKSPAPAAPSAPAAQPASPPSHDD